ncbi:MAG: hypothetical protein AAF591_09785 [Verrucomicrobiota bacterium]
MSRKIARDHIKFPSLPGMTLAGILLWMITPGAHAQEILDLDATPTNPVTIGPGGRITRETPPEAARDREYPFHIHSLWESRYVSEGRDNLDGGSLLSFFNEFSWGPFTFAPWYATGPGSDYDELNLSLIAGTSLGENLELYAGYSHLRFPELNAYDNEIGAGLVYTGLEWADVGGKWYHSFATDGSFFEIIATRTFEFTEKFNLTPYSLLGFNAGYIPAGHDGANNLILGINASYIPFPRFEINSFAAYNWEIDSDPERFPEDELLRNFFWGGAGIRINF